MRKIIAVWLCALLMFSSVLAVGSNVNEEIEGRDVVDKVRWII